MSEETKGHKTLLAKIHAGMEESEIAKGCLDDWPDYSENEKTGKITIYKTNKNVMHFLNRFEIGIRDDAFRWQYILEGVPLRDQPDDKAALDFMFAMDQCGLKIGKDMLWDSLMAIAHLRTTHELRELFDKLEATWAVSYTHLTLPTTPYV